jgi:calcium-dependent protein kinase
MEAVSSSAKSIISKILLPDNKRLTPTQIFKDPWIMKESSNVPLKLNFSKMAAFSKFSKIKKLAATYIATQLSEKEVENLGNLFRQIDLNHDGEISIEELKLALKEEKNQPSIKELAAVMESIDTDKNGRINYT